MNQPPVALSIAGSDSGGGAGVQADLRTFAAHRVFGASVVTALTAQNTCGTHEILVTPTSFVAAQLDAVLADLPVAVVKTGMLADPAIVELLADRELPTLVVDPVLASTSGTRLFPAGAVSAYFPLFARATVVTPNADEAEALLGHEISTVDDAVVAARELSLAGPRCVVITGGHRDWDLTGDIIDVFWCDGQVGFLRGPRIHTTNTHGTGCVLASAVAARLALGTPLPEALRRARQYLHHALRGSATWRLGRGRGPLSWKDVP